MSEWSDLPPDVRGENISIKIIGASGRVWNIAGLDMGLQGAFVAGSIDGMVHVPFEGVWTKPAYGPPRFERTVDSRREITLPIGLSSDTALGWYNTEAKFWNDVTPNTTCYFSITTRPYGEMWMPMQLLEAPKDPMEWDPTRVGAKSFQIWNITLVADGDPRWRPVYNDLAPAPFVSSVQNNHQGVIRVANRGTEPAWPVYMVSAPGKAFLPDGPNAVIGGLDPLVEWPGIGALFGHPEFDPLGIHRRRDAHMIEIPELLAGEHTLVDTDPSHRIAISATDPADNGIKQFLRNSDLLDWIFGEYGDSGLPVLQRFKGQGFSVPIPPKTIATLPVKHSVTGGKIWARIPQRFDRAISA